MYDLFKYVNRTGYDQIYNSLSPEHAAIFLGFVLGFVQMLRISRKPGKEKLLRRLEKISLFVMAAGQGTYFVWFYITGTGGDKWPLYACRIASILLLFTYFVRWMPLEQFSIYTALYGGISSVFYSSPKPFAFPHVTRIAFFMTHIGLAYSALLRILNHDEEIDRRSLRGAQIINSIMIIVVLTIDMLFDWNYMFLMTPQLPTGYLNVPLPHYLQFLTTIGVIAVYFFAVFAAWLFARFLQQKFSPMHYKWEKLGPSVRKSSTPVAIRRIQNRRKQKTEENDKSDITKA